MGLHTAEGRGPSGHSLLPLFGSPSEPGQFNWRANEGIQTAIYRPLEGFVGGGGRYRYCWEFKDLLPWNCHWAFALLALVSSLIVATQEHGDNGSDTLM